MGQSLRKKSSAQLQLFQSSLAAKTFAWINVTRPLNKHGPSIHCRFCSREPPKQLIGLTTADIFLSKPIQLSWHRGRSDLDWPASILLICFFRFLCQLSLFWRHGWFFLAFFVAFSFSTHNLVSDGWLVPHWFNPHTNLKISTHQGKWPSIFFSTWVSVAHFLSTKRFSLNNRDWSSIFTQSLKWRCNRYSEGVLVVGFIPFKNLNKSLSVDSTSVVLSPIIAG